MRINTKVKKYWNISFGFIYVTKIFLKNVNLERNFENTPFKNSILKNLKTNEHFKKMNSPKPNYFICFPLNNEKIENEIVKIQNHVISKYSFLKECAIERKKFHISLLILYIKKSQIDLSIEAFNEAINRIRNVSKQKIMFNKLNTFNNNILYLSVDNNCTDYLKNIVDIFKEAFKKRNIKIIKNEKKTKKKKKKGKEKNEEHTEGKAKTEEDGEENVEENGEENGEEENEGETQYQHNDKTYENNEPNEKKEITKKTNIETEETNEKGEDSKKENAEKEGVKKEEDSKKRSKKNAEEFIPHLTIMKNTRMKSKYKTKKKILIFEDYYSDVDLTNILKEPMNINKFQLLEMNLDKSTSYYKIVTEWNVE